MPQKAFGARPSIEDLSLSPDGMSVAFVAPAAGQGSVVYVQSLAKGATRAIKPILGATGKPERLGGCGWVSNQRLVCAIYGVVNNGILLEPAEFTRLVAVNVDGTKLQPLSTRSNSFTRGIQLGGGNVVDWLPDEDGVVLMTRVYLPDDHTGSHIGSADRGLAVDRIDTQTLRAQTVEQPREDAVAYISDGRGTVRIMGVRSRRGAIGGFDSGNIAYYYRTAGSREWLSMGEPVGEDHKGFQPVAVDHDANLAYGYKKLDGRLALYTLALDGSLKEDLVFARPDVDVGGLNRIGRRHRVVGVSYSDEFSHYHFLDPDFETARGAGQSSARAILASHRRFEHGRKQAADSRGKRSGSGRLLPVRQEASATGNIFGRQRRAGRRQAGQRQTGPLSGSRRDLDPRLFDAPARRRYAEGFAGDCHAARRPKRSRLLGL